MMLKRMVIVLVSGGLFFTVSCAPSRLEMDYGTSYKLMHVNQVLNADAEKNLSPVVGLDGQAAQRLMETYSQGF